MRFSDDVTTMHGLDDFSSLPLWAIGGLFVLGSGLFKPGIVALLN